MESASSQDSGTAFSIRTLRLDEIDASFLHAWRKLEEEALEPNAYLSPSFVLPAARHLHAGDPPFLLAIFARERGRSRLIGLGAFTSSAGTKRFPLPYLSAFKSMHGYTSGLLVHAGFAEEAARALFDHVAGAPGRWHGIDFQDLPMDTQLTSTLLSVAKADGVKWHAYDEYHRAVLRPAAIDEAYYEAAFKRCGGKDMRRRIRRMHELGPVEWKILRGSEIDDAALARFLALENRRWAREQGSSLVAAGHDGFFRETCAQFLADDRLFFVELNLAGKTIASTSLFISGGCAFGFKIGWDDSLSRLSPGIINQLWFLQHMKEDRMGLRYLDSGSQEGSFIDQLWAERRPMASGIFAISNVGGVVGDIWASMRRIKAGLRA